MNFIRFLCNIKFDQFIFIYIWFVLIILINLSNIDLYLSICIYVGIFLLILVIFSRSMTPHISRTVLRERKFTVLIANPWQNLHIAGNLDNDLKLTSDESMTLLPTDDMTLDTLLLLPPCGPPSSIATTTTTWTATKTTTAATWTIVKMKKHCCQKD